MIQQDLSDILIGDEVKDIKIGHKGKEYIFRIKSLSWIKINNILSRCIQYDKNRVTPDLGEFYSLYLEESLVEAPWPLAQTRMYLRKLDNTFGNKLREYLPSPFEVEDDELKKE